MKAIIATITLVTIVLLNICNAQSIRKDYNEMTSDEIDAYVDAIYELHQGIITELAVYHNNNFNSLHFNFDDDDVFLAWHRMANLEMEDAIRTIHPELSIPYWNWVTDNSDNDPLWDPGFLGQFDDDQEYEDLGRTLSHFEGLPDQDDVDDEQSIDTWPNYTFSLEASIVHRAGHNWVGGIMASGMSPLDPVFYMHHGMIDKLWQEWEEVNSASSYQLTSLPRYPNTNPNNITDSRSLNVWYAEDGVVLLDQYETSGTNDYRYTGKIEAENDFIVKNGSNVTFIAGDEIVMGPGFQVESGAEFYAEVDPDVGNIAAKQRSGIAGRPDDVQGETPNVFSLSQNYPNPFNPTTIIPYELASAGHVTLEVFDMLGRRVALLVDEAVSAGRHEIQFNASNLSSGMYIYRIRANQFVQTRQMVLVK